MLYSSTFNSLLGKILLFKIKLFRVLIIFKGICLAVSVALRQMITYHTTKPTTDDIFMVYFMF
jgi:hypothetical protein